MKFGVVIFPGSNCDQDIIHALRHVLGQEVKELWHKEEHIAEFDKEDCIVLPGGFSYGDYLRSGAIARFSPIMDAVIGFANNGGRVLGICNGFQILCEAGLLPGALLGNRDQRFVCRNTWITPATSQHELTAHLKPGKALKIPVAHAEGRYFADEKTVEAVFANDQVLFQYTDEKGKATEAANINGSVRNIAGICNKAGNIMGLMPHPERAAEPEMHNKDGRLILEGLLQKVTA